jgi:hypothetical protein
LKGFSSNGSESREDLTRGYITVFKPEPLRLKGAMDFTMRKLKANSPRYNV